jgi:hypothetical protein
VCCCCCSRLFSSFQIRRSHESAESWRRMRDDTSSILCVIVSAQIKLSFHMATPRMWNSALISLDTRERSHSTSAQRAVAARICSMSRQTTAATAAARRRRVIFIAAKRSHVPNTKTSRQSSTTRDSTTTRCMLIHRVSTCMHALRFRNFTSHSFPAAIENATCIESLGMFVLYKERKNYSSAATTCSAINGQLAHIVTERRTNELSQLLRDSSDGAAAFVGLNETTRGKFITSNAEPLECFDYRAFSPGHPPEIRKPACVVITKRSAWKAASCTKKFEFICELLAFGPNPHVSSNLDRKCSVKRPNNRFAPKKATGR